MFKKPFFLRNENKDKSTSQLGLFFSIGIIIFLFVFCSNSDVFYHNRPKIVDQSLFLKHRERIELNSQNFGLIAALTDDPGKIYVDNTIFSISISQHVLNISSHEYIYEEQKNLHLCNEDDFNYDPSVMVKFGLKDYFCPENKSFVLEGYWDETIINHVYVTVSMCDNKTMNNTCKSYEEILDYMSDKLINIFYIDSSYDLTNYENPIQSSYKIMWWTLGANIRKIAHLYFKKIQILSDDGFFFENPQLIESFKKEANDLEVDLNYKEYLFQAQIYSSSQIQYSIRDYQKIQEVIASMGGMLSLFVTLGYLIINPLTKLNIIKSIMNELYVFQKDQANKTNKYKLKIINKNFKKKLNSNEKVDIKNENHEIINKVRISGIFKRLKTKIIGMYDKRINDGLYFSFFEYIKFNFKYIFQMKLNVKEKLFKKTEKVFNKQVDLKSILHKLHEFEKLKIILLDERQLNLFQVLSKPMLFLRNKKKLKPNLEIENNPSARISSFFSDREKVKKGNKDSFLNAYKETLEKMKTNNNEIDERLLYFFDKKISGEIF